MLDVSLTDFLVAHPGQHAVDITRAVQDAHPELIAQLRNRVLHGTVPPMGTTPVAAPINSVQGIESLVLFGLQIFVQVFSLFNHPTQPIPTAAAPALVQQLQQTPGISSDHAAVAALAVTSAVEAHKLTQPQS